MSPFLTMYFSMVYGICVLPKSSVKIPKMMVVFVLNLGNYFIIQICDSICNIWLGCPQA
jgi:hypothetical protein